MIYSKGRRSVDLIRKERQRELSVLKDVNACQRRKNANERQRHSISSMSPISNNRNDTIFFHPIKQSDKKYNYSQKLDSSLDISSTKYEKANHNCLMGSIQRKKYIYQNQCKFFNRYSEGRQRQIQQHATSLKYHYKFEEFDRENFKSNAPSLNQQHENIQKPQKQIYQPIYQSVQRKKISNLQNDKENYEFQNILAQKDPFLKQRYQNHNIIGKSYQSVNKYQLMIDNYTSKADSSTNKAKYESKYTKMRNRHCELLVKQQKKVGKAQNERGVFPFQSSAIQQQNIMPPRQPQKTKEVSTLVDEAHKFAFNLNYRDQTLQISRKDLQTLLINSQTQNLKIKQKLNRIFQLNQQINSKLQNMLSRKQIY